VLRTDRELLLLPLFSGLASLLVVASFAAPAWLSLRDTNSVNAFGAVSSSKAPTVLTYVLGIVFYFVTAFVVIFFNAALVFGANQRFEGGDPTLRSALAGAWSRLGLILQWSAVSATVSMIIGQIQERGGILGRIVGAVIGFAWAVVTFLVLPILVVEGVSVGEAFRRSREAIRTTWGENVIGQVGIGVVTTIAILPVMVLMVGAIAAFQTSIALGAVLLAVSLGCLVAVVIVTTALGVVYQTALYRYANQLPTTGFEPTALAGAFGPRTSRWR
jgi:hypothetical protein